MTHIWEEIKTDSVDATFRLPVFGGWLVKTKNKFKIQEPDGISSDYRHSLTFVPDVDHEWDLNQKIIKHCDKEVG